MSYGGGGGSGGGSGSTGSAGYGSKSSGDLIAPIEYPPLQPTPVGAFRFNTDSSKLEYYDGNQWVNVTSTSPNQQTGGTRGFMGGGLNNDVTGNFNAIEYYQIETTGNAIDFGDLVTARATAGTGNSTKTRGLFMGGYIIWGDYTNQIDYITISTTGNAADFGDLTIRTWNAGQGSDNTRAIMCGGRSMTPNVGGDTINTIQQITVASTGNAIDFGDCTIPMSGCGGQNGNSPTRAVWGSSTSNPVPGTNVNVMNYVNIASGGNAGDFGDLPYSNDHGPGGSNAIRGVMKHGKSDTFAMNYITIATLGDAIDFGDLQAMKKAMGTAASPTRMTFASGQNNPAYTNAIEYVQIMTTGDGTDFGDISGTARRLTTGFSNGHGGLG